MLVMDETEPNPPPAPSADHAEAQSLIITGKRSRRKVNLSAEFLYDHPTRSHRLKVHDDEISHGGDIGSPSQRKRRRSSISSTKTPDGLIIKRNRLQQRKLELEAYLKRLQVALAVERNHVNGIGPAPTQLVTPDPFAAVHAESNGVPPPLSRAPTGRRKSLPSVSKKKDVRPPPPAFVDDDSVDISLKACIRIVDDLIHNQYGDVFATPVDWVALGLPSYPEIIKQPMDLGTIRQRLSASYYSTLSAFITDVQLVWDNAKKFNLPKSFVHEATLEMERIWNRKKDYLKRERRKTFMSVSKGDAAAAESPATVTPAPGLSTAITRPLSLLEMSKLRADLVKVPSELYPKIAEITGSTVVNQPDSEAGGVLHVDVDKLPAETQRQLQQFVASVLPKNNSRPRPPLAPTRKLSNSMTSIVTTLISSESDSDSSSSSGLESDSSEDDHVVPPLLPIASQPMQEADTRVDEVVNTDAWSNLSTEEPPTDDKFNEKKDPLWSDYQNMSAEAQQRKKELMQKEEARQKELERQTQERARLDERSRLEREEQEKKRAADAALREEEKNRQISEEREKARRALEHDDETDDQADMGFLSSIFGS